MRLGFFILGLLACCARPESRHSTLSPDVEQRYEDAVERLLSRHLERGTWVVTRAPDGSPEHVGEALLWSGVALSALPCDKGAGIEAGLVAMIEAQGGALVRYEPLGEYVGGREVTLDGALGLYRGASHRARRCGRRDQWREAIRLHLAFLEGHDWRPNEAVAESIPEPFRVLVQDLAAELGVGEAGAKEDRLKLEGAVAGWAAAVNAGHKACYRIHLGWLALETIDELARVSPAGWNAFCAATRGTDLPVVEHFCHRGDLEAWADSFTPNEWEYRHQRCPAWESPDGDGDETPALDLLVAITRSRN